MWEGMLVYDNALTEEDQIFLIKKAIDCKCFVTGLGFEWVAACDKLEGLTALTDGAKTTPSGASLKKVDYEREQGAESPRES